MAHGIVSVGAERIIALATAREPSWSKTELYSCLALLFGAIATLTAIITYLAMAPSVPIAAANLTGARSLLASLGLVTSVLAFFSARLFVRRRVKRPLRRLRIDAGGIALETVSHRDPRRVLQERLIDLSSTFGITLLSDPVRHRLVLAVTGTGRAVYFSARVNPEERHAYRRLLSHTSTVSDDDAVLDALGPDGAPLELKLVDMNAFLEFLLLRDDMAMDRCFLSDTHGAPVVLDNHELHIGRQGFDLRAPLEWRAMLFQEPFGTVNPVSDREPAQNPPGGVMVYQATWVRQGISEAVLVSLIPSVSSVATPPHPPVGEVPEVASAVLRDLRLMQASPEPPPPAELRVAIERMYMVRLRAALDRAPRASHKDIPSAAPPS
ncbi:MAG: hypothetical protein ABW133_13275 [Polyangiaceae bacterium]